MTAAPYCACGEVTGVRCVATRGELVVVETMPGHLRASHAAANNRGLWPSNGAVRLHMTRECAKSLRDEWTEIVGKVKVSR